MTEVERRILKNQVVIMDTLTLFIREKSNHVPSAAQRAGYLEVLTNALTETDECLKKEGKE